MQGTVVARVASQFSHIHLRGTIFVTIFLVMAIDLTNYLYVNDTIDLFKYVFREQ